tara:strand:+ start:879 stop:1085 length:207 start_codon:yes stop_codon:yes gene_type:complete
MNLAKNHMISIRTSKGIQDVLLNSGNQFVSKDVRGFLRPAYLGIGLSLFKEKLLVFPLGGILRIPQQP